MNAETIILVHLATTNFGQYQLMRLAIKAEFELTVHTSQEKITRCNSLCNSLYTNYDKFSPWALKRSLHSGNYCKVNIYHNLNPLKTAYIACYCGSNWWVGAVQDVNPDEKNVQIKFLNHIGPTNSFTWLKI